MNKLILLLSFAFLASCGQHEPKTNSTESEKSTVDNKDKKNEKITFYKVNGKAILLGNKIQLLDTNFKPLKDISAFNEQFVEVMEVSDKFHKANPADEYCEEFKYVKIKGKNFEGYVDGRKLYEPSKDLQNKIVKVDNNEISFTATSNFGIGVTDDDGLTFCETHTPLIFSDKSQNYEGLVKMVLNKNYDSKYPYFELKADDEASDEIVNVEKQENKYLVKIKRTYQEGAANLLVSIQQNNTGVFTAEILEVVTTKE